MNNWDGGGDVKHGRRELQVRTHCTLIPHLLFTSTTTTTSVTICTYINVYMYAFNINTHATLVD